MMRLPITSATSRWIEQRIAGLTPGVPASGALLLYVDTEGSFGIRPDGTIVGWSRIDGSDARPEEDRAGILIALNAGVRRYPELKELLPTWGLDADDCECRKLPAMISGLFWCGECGRMGWVAEGRPCAFGHPDWPYREVLLESIVGRQALRMVSFGARHLLPRVYSPLVLVQVALAFLSFYGAFLILAEGWRGYLGNGIGLILLGIASLAVATRGIGRRRADRPRPPRSPSFAPDDPEVAALPPTSTTLLSERMRMARERQKRATD